MPTLNPLLYCFILYAGFFCAGMQVQGRAPAMRIPKATLGLLAIVGIPSLLQFAFPVILTTLERNWPLILQGQVWRIVTALTVQDGGLFGTVFNLTGLLLIGIAAERLWGPARMAAIFMAGGVITEFLAYFWQPVGGGNSIANFALSAATAVLGLMTVKNSVVRAIAVAILAAGVILLIRKDIHGIAVVVGAILGLIVQRIGAKDLPLPSSSA